MSQNIRYSVVFLDFWHLSSGLSGGARLDSICIKMKRAFALCRARVSKVFCVKSPLNLTKTS